LHSLAYRCRTAVELLRRLSVRKSVEEAKLDDRPVRACQPSEKLDQRAVPGIGRDLIRLKKWHGGVARRSPQSVSSMITTRHK